MKRAVDHGHSWQEGVGVRGGVSLLAFEALGSVPHS